MLERFHPKVRAIERFRHEYAEIPGSITFTDHGRGGKETTRSHRQLAFNASVSPERGRALFRIARKKRPAYVLELGTCIGISTAYIQAGRGTGGTFDTVEGSTLAREAHHTLARLNLHQNVFIVPSTFDAFFEDMAGSVGYYELAFVDGHHQLTPTLNYTAKLLPLMREGGTIIYDDIDWSTGMRTAWNRIRAMPHFTRTYEVCGMGVCELK